MLLVYAFTVFVDVCRAQWLMGRASDSRITEPGPESCAAVAIIFKPIETRHELIIAHLLSSLPNSNSNQFTLLLHQPGPDFPISTRSVGWSRGFDRAR